MPPLVRLWFRYEAKYIDRVPADGAALLLINHQSHLDPILSAVWLPRPVCYVARDTLYRVPLLGWFLRNAYVIPISRTAPTTATIRAVVNRLENGFLVGVFPEGTRCRDGKLGQFQPGFLSFVRRSKVPIIPVGISGSFEAMPRGAAFVRPKKICVVYGEPIGEEEGAEEGLTRHERDQRLLEVARQRVAECVSEAESLRGVNSLEVSTPNG